jgi:hypothetical protein
MGVCGAKSSKPFVPGQKAMERLELEEREQKEKKVEGDDKEGAKDPGEEGGLKEDEKKHRIGTALSLSVKPEDIHLDVKDESPDLLKRTQTNQSFVKKPSIGNVVSESNKNIEEKRKTLLGISKESGVKNDPVVENKLSKKTSILNEQKIESKQTLLPREDSPDFRLIKMQSGDSVQMLDVPSQILKKAKQPQPKTGSIQPGKGITGDNPHLSLTTNPILPSKIESSPNIEEKPKEKEKFFLSQKNLIEQKQGLESKPTTTQDKSQKDKVITTLVEHSEKKENIIIESKNKRIATFTPVKAPNISNDNDYLGFATIKEQTEPEPSGMDKKSMNQFLELSSKQPKKSGAGESSLNFQLTVTPNTDKNLQLLRQNLEDRNEVVAKPNFSCALLSKEVLQIIKMEEVVHRRDELNKEIVLLDLKKHEELFEMVRTDQFRHSQTKPCKVAGGWMEFEAEGEVWKDRT